MFYNVKTAGFCLKSHTLLFIGPLIQSLLCLYVYCVFCVKAIYTAGSVTSSLFERIRFSYETPGWQTQYECVCHFIRHEQTSINRITMLGLNLSTSLCSKQITLVLGKSASLMQFSSTVMKPVSNADAAIQIHSTDSSVIKYPYCRALKTECG